MDAKGFKTSIKTKVFLALGLAIVILVTAGVIAYQSFNDLTKSLNFLSKPDIKLVRLNDLLSDLSISEDNIRSYFISHEKKYLDQYNLYSNKLDKNIRSLPYLTDGSSMYAQKSKEVFDLWIEKKKHTGYLIQLYTKSQDYKVPVGFLKKLNQSNPEVPTIIITKTITIKKREIINKQKKDVVEESKKGPKKSFLGRIFKKKDELPNFSDTLLPTIQTTEKVTTLIDTIYSAKEANKVKEKAFSKMLLNLSRQNLKSRKELTENETEVIQKDIKLIEYIRNIVIDLKNAEQKITDRNIEEAKAIVQVSLLKIFGFGISGIVAILILGFLIINDVTKNNYHRTQLLHEKVRAEELVKAKENFLAMMSHEIRTPLNSIIGFTEQLSLTNLQNRQRYFLQAVSSSTAHLLSLVNDILDHSRLEAGKVEFERTAFSLKEAIESVFDAFYIKALEKNISMTHSIEGTEDLVVGDSLRFKQILINLVSNAIKFTEKGSITINCNSLLLEGDKIKVSVSVRDTGIGIPSDKIHNIFDSFSQADSSITRKFGGTGLGLSIVKNLVELQKGNVYVSSEEGKGSDFTFCITYHKFSKGIVLKPEFETPDITQLYGMNVLVIEDDDLNLLLFHTILIKWGIKVTMLSRGEEVLQVLNKKRFDLIITDINIPGMSGIDISKSVKKNPDKSISSIPVLAVTANVIKESESTIRESGFNEILFKPFKEEQLALSILRVTGKNFYKVIIEEEVERNNSDQGILLDFIKFSGDNTEALNQLVEAFILNTLQLLDKMKLSLEEKEWSSLKEVTHRLIPGFGYLRNHKLVTCLEEIETYLKVNINTNEDKLKKMIEFVLENGYKEIEILKKSDLNNINSKI